MVKAGVMQGIDVSKWQKGLALTKDLDFVILRIGYGKGTRDPQFETFYQQAKALGIKVGCYFYTYDVTLEEAAINAQKLTELLKGHSFELPVFLDVEEQSQLKKGTEFISELITTYGAEVERTGYAFGYYMSTSPANYLIPECINRRYIYWAAQYGSKLTTRHRVDIWQNTSRHPYNGKLVDHDIAYTDFSWIIEKGLTGGT